MLSTRWNLQIGLLAILIVNVLASMCHYADNLLYFNDYPEPDWFNPVLTDSLWLIMTPFGLLGYWLYGKALFPWAFACLYFYVFMSLIVFGHYLVTPLWQISLKINLMIWGEAIAAFVLLGFTGWLQWHHRTDQPVSWD